MMWRPTRENLGSALLALALALMVWSIATTEGNPLRDDLFPEEGLPIEVVNIPAGHVLFEPITQRAKARIRGPQSAWPGLDASQFRAFVDLSGLTSGIHEVPVQIQCPQCSEHRVQVLGAVPEKISVRLEEYLEKEVDVFIEILDNPALGYTYRPPIVTPRKVKVSGPRSQVEQVNRVVGRVFLQEAKDDVERQVSVVPQDHRNRLVAKVEVSPSIVAVRVPIEERRGYKEVSVTVVTKGTPAVGYYISNLTVTPSRLTIFGTPVLLEQAPGFLETEPIDVTGARETIEREVGLVVPEGVSILGDRQTVTARVEISPIRSGQTLQLPLTPRGLRPDLRASLSPDTVQVILSGPLPDLEALKPGDVQAILDLSGLTPGTHKLTPIIIKPASLKAESIVPDEVEVVISTVPTPTPTPLPKKPAE